MALLSFLLMVVAPTIAATYYTAFWASNRFVSEFRVAVRAIQPIKTGGMADLFGFAGVSQAGNDFNAVVQYLQSRKAIEDLGPPRPPKKTAYDNPSIDWFSRLQTAADRGTDTDRDQQVNSYDDHVRPERSS